MFIFASLLLCLVFWPISAPQARGQDTPRPSTKEIAKEELPREAHATLQLIKQGGPFPYQRDGSVFGNFERRLPLKKRAYYREYTVPTPGRRDRGARRIVAGAQGEYYYTEDHYRTFRKIRAQP
jgi:ribonuclease T1